MIKAVDKEYVRDNLVQLMVGTSDTEIIMDNEDILLLKVNNVLYIDKYLNHQRRGEFPYQDIPMHKENDTELYNVLFEMNKDYLILEMDEFSHNIIMNHFAKTRSGALWRDEVAEDYNEDIYRSLSYTKEQLASLFDPHNYDCLFVIDTYGRLVIASSKKDGIILNGAFLPTDEEVKSMEGNIVNLCGGMYPAMKFISSKNGKFDVWAFSLVLDRDSTYVLDKYPIKLPRVKIGMSMKRRAYEETNKVSM